MIQSGRYFKAAEGISSQPALNCKDVSLICCLSSKGDVRYKKIEQGLAEVRYSLKC